MLEGVKENHASLVMYQESVVILSANDVSIAQTRS
jgi:hypothetical protein